jgi:putative hydrolase of HD superfamily
LASSVLKAKILMNIARTGWLMRGVPVFLAESVAEHSFLATYICLELGSRIQGVDFAKAALYALLHDLGEAFTGDLMKPIAEKFAESVEQLELSMVSMNIDNQLIVELYKRFIQQSDFEAKLAKLCNYIATLVVGIEYKTLGYGVDDIVRNTCNEVEETSKRLNVESEVKHLLSELRIECSS